VTHIFSLISLIWSVLFFWNTKARYVYSQIGSRIITFCSFGLIMLINFADN
jgi:hypothetical protein